PAWTGFGPVGLVQRAGMVTFVDPDNSRVFAGLGPDESFQYRPLGQDVPWTTLATHGPTMRFGAVGVSDPGARRALVFGGGSGLYPVVPGEQYSDLWSFAFDGFGWTLLNSDFPAIPRADALGVFDTAHRRLVIHGGYYTNPGPVALGDTWIFDADRGTWSAPSAG